MLDKKGRLFGRVSVVDLFVVIVLIGVFMVVYLNVGGREWAVVTGPARPVYITFFHPALEDFTVNALEYGAPVINDADGTFMGNVVGIKPGESVGFAPDRHGNEVASPMAGYSSVSIQSRVYGHISDGALVLAGNVYAVGEEIIIWAGAAKTMLLISEITVEQESLA